MPVVHKFLITLQIRRIDPFLYLHLCTVPVGTFMDLQDIPESILSIISAQREQPAESRPVLMNGASSLFIKENTALLLSCHGKVRKDIAVHHAQFQFFRHQLVCAFMKSPAKPPDIIRIKDDRIPHSLTAVAAASAVLAVRLHHIVGLI